MNYKSIIEAAKKNSISTQSEELHINIKKVSKRVFLLLTATLLSLSLCACSTNKYNQREIDSFLQTRSDYAMSVLRTNECLGEDEQILSLDVETYRKLLDKEISIRESDLIGYYELLGEQESEKIVIALGYEGWNDYLTKHGESSIESWKQTEINEYQKIIDKSYEYNSQNSYSIGGRL